MLYSHSMNIHARPSTLWIASVSLAGVALLWFLWPYLSVVVLTALMAYLFYPLYIKLRRKNGFSAAVTTLFVSILIVVLPLLFVLVTALLQLLQFANFASQYESWSGLLDMSRVFIEQLNSLVKPISGQTDALSIQSITDFLRNSLPVVARTGANVLFGVVANVPQLGIAALLYTFLFVEFLLRGPALVAKLRSLSPYDSAATDRYLERIGLMAGAMVKGQLIISMIISAISAALLIPLGYGQYFFILFVLFTILNFIPLGCGIVMVPLALYSMLTGQFWMGLAVIVLYFLAGNIESPLRSYLIPKKIQLSVGITMLSTFCGIAYFGILGVVYGPIIMILIVTTFDLYREQLAVAPKPRTKKA